jgi:hypothetical protein
MLPLSMKATPYLKTITDKRACQEQRQAFQVHIGYRGFRLITRERIPPEAEQRFSFAAACPVECEADSSGVSRQTKSTYLCDLCVFAVRMGLGKYWGELG